MKLSIVIPVFNEKKTLEELVKRLLAVKLPRVTKEIILVEDASTDGTRAVLKKLAKKHPKFKVFYQQENGGKGAAVRTG